MCLYILDKIAGNGFLGFLSFGHVHLLYAKKIGKEMIKTMKTPEKVKP